MEIAWFIGGVCVGAVVAGFWISSRERSRGVATQRDLEARLGVSEGVSSVLQSQLHQRDEAVRGLSDRLDLERSARVEADTRYEAAVANMNEQKALLDDAKIKLSDAFKALSTSALDQNREQFAKQAEEKIKPLKEALDRYEKQIREFETVRVKESGGLAEKLTGLAATHQELQDATRSLGLALRSSSARGRWGELQLRRVVEFAGMTSHCDFDEQVSVSTESGRLRPDVVIHLPNNRDVVVDSKVPLNAYLEAVEAKDDELRQGCLKRHAQAVKDHMKKLASKGYRDQFENSPDFVVMFIPGESSFSAALEADGTLIEEGAKQSVILATPTTLIALLRAVAYGWRQQEVVENAEHIAAAGRELFERVRVMIGHFAEVGARLGQATESYNSVAESYKTRVRPSGQRMIELGVTSPDRSLPEVEGIEAVPKRISRDGVNDL